jgi:general secretion pathway protein J
MSACRRRGRCAGFTLLEMMIGLVLLGLMMTVLFSGLRLGASSWDAAERKVASVAERELAIRVLERQLALAMPVMHAPEGEPERLAFEGESDRLIWVSPLPAYRGGGGVHELELALGATDRGAGLVLHYRLFHPDVLDGSAGSDRESVLLLEDVNDLRLSYYGAMDDSERDEWVQRWDHDRDLPGLVKVELGFGESPEGLLTLVVEPRQGYRSTEVDFGPFPN